MNANIKIIKDNRQIGSTYEAKIIVGDTAVGTFLMGCPDPYLALKWDDNEGQWLIVTLLPKLAAHDDVEKWVRQQIKRGNFPVYTA